jgi:hypothetical protein
MFKSVLVFLLTFGAVSAADVLKDKETLSTVAVGAGYIASDGTIVWTNCDGKVTNYGPASGYIIRKGGNCGEGPSNQAPGAGPEGKAPDAQKAEERRKAEKPD